MSQLKMSQLVKFASFIPFLLLSCKAFGQQEAYASNMDSLLKTASARAFNGVVLISQNGKTKYAKAYGYANFDKKTPLKLDDPFVILSNSKQITAVLLLQEIDKGRIDLRAVISKYLPDLKQTWADTVSVHNLLNHTSGIVGLDAPLAFNAGTRFNYSDLNYTLLGKIIELASKSTYETQVNALFKRCGMKNTFFPNTNNQHKVVNGYAYLKDANRKEISGVIIPKDRVPAAGIVSTVHDLARWNDQLHTGKLLKPATYQLMTSYSIKAQHPIFGDQAIGYGYGIRVNDLDKVREYGHTGIVPDQGFTSVNLYYPATETSVIVLENQAFDNLDISYYFEKAIRNIIKHSNLLQKEKH